jgi:hypothetical protein
MRPTARALLAVLVLAVIGIAPPASAAAAEEAEVLALVNAARTGSGLPRLRLDTELVDEARAHTAAMLSEGDIFHSRAGDLARSTAEWELLGENVGYGPDPHGIHQAFMQSETHRANILGTYDRAAVGTGRSPDGRLFVTVLFVERAGEDAGPASGGDELPSLVRAVAAFPRSAVSQVLTLLDAAGSPRPWCGTPTIGTACVD